MTKPSFIAVTATMLVATIFHYNSWNSQNIFKGTYKIAKSKNNSQKSLIKGQLIDKKTGEYLIGLVEIRDEVVKSDTNGLFFYEVQPGYHTISGLSLPYYKVTTKPIKIGTGETVTIKFFLQEDKRPLIDKNM